MDEKYIGKIMDNEVRSKSNENRLDKVEKQYELLYKMNTNIEVIAQKMQNQEGEIKEVKEDVKILKEKPSKNWNSLTTAIITALASGIAGAFLMLILK